MDNLDSRLVVGSPSGINLAASWDAFWKALEAPQESFWNDFHIVLGYNSGNAILKPRKMNLTDFEAAWRSQNRHFARKGLQKSNFRSDGYPMLILIDFGSILDRFWSFLGEENQSKMKINSHGIG